MRPRWDIDERGRGVGDGRRLHAGAAELLEALAEPDWVAEDPHAHLLPHLRRACADGSLGLELLGAESAPDGAYAVRLRWSGAPHDLQGLRVAVFALLGSIAESATYVRQRRVDETGIDPGDPPPGVHIVFEVGTGMLEPDTPYASHGHVLVLSVERDA